MVVAPRAYLDNVITSGWVLKDLQPPEEMAAVEHLYELHDAGTIKRVTSKMSGIEQARTTDLQKRAALAASADLVSVVQNDHRLLGFANLDYGAPMDFSKLTMKTMVRYMKSHEGIRRVSEGLRGAGQPSP